MNKKHRTNKPHKIYALYKGDELLATGTAREIAKQMDVEINTIYYYRNPAYLKRVKGTNHRELIVIE